MNDVEIAREGVMKEIAEKRRIEAEKAGVALKAQGSSESVMRDKNLKDKCDQPETYIPTGPPGTPGGSSGGGRWVRAGYEDEDPDEGVE